MFKIFFWLFMLMTTVLFLIPSIYVSGGVFNLWDKSQHATMFGILMILAFCAYPKKTNALVLSLIAYGGFIELVQSLTEWRHGDIFDWIADVFGILGASVLIHTYQRIRSRMIERT